jgi:AP-4 complex subunit sigma-1
MYAGHRRLSILERLQHVWMDICFSPTTASIDSIFYRNKQGQTRLSSYYEWITMAERTALESEIIRKCLSRSELQCSFLEYRGYKVVYRRYASLFFIVGTKPSPDEEENQENELGVLEFIHTLVETMDKWAGSICELDIMYQLEQVHFLLDEMVMNGCIVETNKANILRPLDLMERESQKAEAMYR